MKIFLAIAYLLTLCLCTHAQPERQVFHNYFYDQRRSFFEAMPDTPNEVIMLGNSITNCGNWNELFPDVNVRNRGISGDISLGVLDRMDEVVSSKPSKVFILIGINDIAQNIAIDTILYNYTRIVDKIQTDSPKTKIYIQSLMPTNDAFDTFKNHQGKMDKVTELNTGLEALAKLRNVHFIDLHPHFMDSEGKLSNQYTNDGLHLLGAGYSHWASIIRKYIYYFE